jgi:hypothetical protein
MRLKLCPKCGQEMEHQDDEPDVGIVGGWYCTKCEEAYLDELSYYEDD